MRLLTLDLDSIHTMTAIESQILRGTLTAHKLTQSSLKSLLGGLIAWSQCSHSHHTVNTSVKPPLKANLHGAGGACSIVSLKISAFDSDNGMRS